jgi:hypothetical protein
VCLRLTRTSNIERPTSNVEWEKVKKQTYDVEEKTNIDRPTHQRRTVSIERRMGKDEKTEKVIQGLGTHHLPVYSFIFSNKKCKPLLRFNERYQVWTSDF